jgi:hypothetical protein
MKTRMLAAWLFAMSISTMIPMTAAQSPFVASKSEPYVPQLSGIMTSAQLEHLKLWSAGTAGNWRLASYELRQLKESLIEAALLYSGIPVSNVTTLAASIDAISAAVDQKDRKQFVKKFAELTKGCNTCHQSMDRAFIAIQIPAEQPFANQLFSPKVKP